MDFSPVANCRKLVGYLGLNPSEDSTGDHQCLGAISKQGNRMMRWLLVEGAQTAARLDPDLRRIFQRLKYRQGASVAKVAIARKLAVKLHWRLRGDACKAPPFGMQGSRGLSVRG